MRRNNPDMMMGHEANANVIGSGDCLNEFVNWNNYFCCFISVVYFERWSLANGEILEQGVYWNTLEA